MREGERSRSRSWGGEMRDRTQSGELKQGAIRKSNYSKPHPQTHFFFRPGFLVPYVWIVFIC